MSDILAAIIADKHLEVAAAQRQRSLAEVERLAYLAPRARDFYAALASRAGARIIAECKSRSPSRGPLLDPYDPVALALAYERGGAAAISVLTDAKYFGGQLAHLTAVRAAVHIPVLRKDFIVSAYQIYEARAAGADAFLLISGVLAAVDLEPLIQLGRQLGMEPLIESHTEAEFAEATTTSGRILGVNNRNLKTFGIDLAISRKLAGLALGKSPVPLMVCESGIKVAADVELMQGVGYNVFLVGELLITHADPEAAVRTLITPSRGP